MNQRSGAGIAGIDSAYRGGSSRRGDETSIGPMMPGSVRPSRAHDAATPRVHSVALFEGGSRVIIAHGATEYLLSITRQGKLILTK